MDIKELRNYLAQAIKARRNNNNDLVIYPVDMLDPIDAPAVLDGATYGVFIKQSYNTRPVPAHWLPVPKQFNDLVAGYGI